MNVFPDAVGSIGGSHAKGIDTNYQDVDIKSKKKMPEENNFATMTNQFPGGLFTHPQVAYNNAPGGDGGFNA